MIAALNGLPSEFDMIRTVLVARDTSLSFKDFRNQLLAAEQATEARVLSSHAPMVGMLSHSSSSGSSHAFSGFGHGDGLLPTPLMPPTAYMCSQPFGRSSSHASGGRGKFSGSRPFGRGFQGRFHGPPKSSGGVVPKCQICSKRGHTAVNCYFRNSNPSSHGSSSTIEYQICGKKGHGALDCYHRSNYVYQGSPPPASITAMAAQTSFSLDAVWIADSGASHHMDKITNRVLFHGKSDHGLYPIPCLVPSSICVDNKQPKMAFLGQQIHSSLWHRRLGHPTNEVIQLMLKEAQLPVVSDSISQICSYCLNVDGYRYVVSFIDEYTGFLWLYLFCVKSEVFSVFRKFFAFITNHFHASVKYFQSDGGGEYMSHQFQDFLSTHGIVHQVSCPYTPQQNGLAERKNRHFVETAITLLTEASMPDIFWFHAMAHSAYLINRMPSKVLANQSPYFRLMQKLPDIRYLRVFGTAVYPCLRETNSHKLQPRIASCVFMGYLMGYKGVLCYNCTTHRFVISRHVIHDELVYPFKHPSTLHSNIMSSLSPSLSINLPSTRVILSENLDSHVNHPSSSPCRGKFSPAVPLPLIVTEASSSSIQPLEGSFPVSSDHHVSPIEHVNFGSSSSLPSSWNIHPMTTRSKSGLCQKKSFEDYQCFTSMHDSTTLDEPSTFRVASFSLAWIKAVEEEISALTMQGTWCLVPRPANTNIVGSKWIYKIKRNSDGILSRYKARLVAQGFSQEAGFDYDETFSPVVRHTTVHLILSLAAINGWSLRQLDVKNAFLHGDLDEEVYMKQPQGFEDSSHPDYVCKLQKSLYGLKQAPRAWNAKFTGYLPSLGFKMSHSDPSLFVKISDSAIVVLLLYVDDIILTGSNSQVIEEVITDLGSVFDLKDLGPLTFFLGLQISYKSNGDLFISQQKYAKDLLVKAGMKSCRPCLTPSKPHTQVLPTDGEPLKEPSVYRSIVHFQLVKRILRYIQGTLHYGLTYSSSIPVSVFAYSDADWAGDITTRRSTTGFVVFLGSNPISWQSKKQGSVSRSSTEAEYRALANASAKVAWIRQILADLHVFLPDPPLLFCDNMSALALSSNPVFHSRIKHLDVDFHFVRECVQRKDFLVHYIPTDEQVAYVLTKGLHSPVFVKHCTNLSLGTLTEIERGCLPNG
ncbi:unnamed protein product [Prunus armeniaca]